MLDFYSGSLPKAKKAHQCEFCGKTIATGEIYSRERGVYCGDFFDRLLCISCLRMLEAYCADVDNEFSWDDVYDYVQDKHCCTCENWDECDFTIHECKKITNFYSGIKDGNNEKDQSKLAAQNCGDK